MDWSLEESGRPRKFATVTKADNASDPQFSFLAEFLHSSNRQNYYAVARSVPEERNGIWKLDHTFPLIILSGCPSPSLVKSLQKFRPY